MIAAALLAAALGACTETIELSMRIEVPLGQNGCPDALSQVEFPFAHSIHVHVISGVGDVPVVLAGDCADIDAEPGRDIRDLPPLLDELIDIGPLEPTGEPATVELVVYHQQVEFCDAFSQDRMAVVRFFGRADVVLDEDPGVVSLQIECVDL